MPNVKTTALQLDIVERWVQGMSTRDICEELKCSAETVRLVKKREDLKEIFYARQREQVIDLIPLAIRRLKDILRDPDTQATAAVGAIKEVFERAHLSELTDNADREIKITVTYE